jgi:hypothetical protein
VFGAVKSCPGEEALGLVPGAGSEGSAGVEVGLGEGGAEPCVELAEALEGGGQAEGTGALLELVESGGEFGVGEGEASDEELAQGLVEVREEEIDEAHGGESLGHVGLGGGLGAGQLAEGVGLDGMGLEAGFKGRKERFCHINPR